MADILHELSVNAPPDRVFGAMSDPTMLSAWWTLSATGTPALGAVYALSFGPGYQWAAQVTRCEPGSAFALTMTRADGDWMGTTVEMELAPAEAGTQVRFAHRGWLAENAHFRMSSYCWAMYLRLMKRHLERGEIIPYEARLET